MKIIGNERAQKWNIILKVCCTRTHVCDACTACSAISFSLFLSTLILFKFLKWKWKNIKNVLCTDARMHCTRTNVKRQQRQWNSRCVQPRAACAMHFCFMSLFICFYAYCIRQAQLVKTCWNSEFYSDSVLFFFHHLKRALHAPHALHALHAQTKTKQKTKLKVKSWWSKVQSGTFETDVVHVQNKVRSLEIDVADEREIIGWNPRRTWTMRCCAFKWYLCPWNPPKTSRDIDDLSAPV